MNFLSSKAGSPTSFCHKQRGAGKIKNYNYMVGRGETYVISDFSFLEGFLLLATKLANCSPTGIGFNQKKHLATKLQSLWGGFPG